MIARWSWQGLQKQRPRLLCVIAGHFLALQQCHCVPAPLRGAVTQRGSSCFFLLCKLLRLLTTKNPQPLTQCVCPAGHDGWLPDMLPAGGKLHSGEGSSAWSLLYRYSPLVTNKSSQSLDVNSAWCWAQGPMRFTWGPVMKCVSRLSAVSCSLLQCIQKVLGTCSRPFAPFCSMISLLVAACCSCHCLPVAANECTSSPLYCPKAGL